MIAPITGMKMSWTAELTMAPKAAPMITPTARSTTFPRSANFLNSSSIAESPSPNAAKVGDHPATASA